MLALSILTLAFIIFVYNKEKNDNLKIIQAELMLFNDIVYKSLQNNTPYDSIPIPSNIRITIIDTNTIVLYDNFNPELNKSHTSRSEIISAAEHGTGSSLRYSSSFGTKFFYFAKKYPSYYIRTSLEYKKDILPQIESEQQSMSVIIFLSILLICIIFYITKRLSKPIASLNQFIDVVKGPDKDYSKIQFSNDEFGLIGKKIIGTFEQLEQAKLYKQQMSHNIAHELKTPVTGIMAYLETILHDPEMDKAQTMKFTEKAYAQTVRLSSLINDVSTLNKLDEGSDTFNNEEIILSHCIKEVCDEIGYKLEANQITFESFISSDLKITGCYSLIYSLFKNLIDNTIEHGGPNIKITLAAGIKQISGEGGYRIDFTYSDTGKGIPSENLPRIFERFYRIEKGRTRKTGGSGLGLAIVKNAVLYHKGNITVENRPEGGLIFKFCLYSL